MAENMDKDNDSHESDMKKMSRMNIEHHVSPSPNAQVQPGVFPKELTLWLLVSIGVGSVLGFLFGWLLQSGSFSIPNAEELYSMTPFTFRMFWLFAGAAAGIVIASAAMLTAKNRREE